MEIETPERILSGVSFSSSQQRPAIEQDHLASLVQLLLIATSLAEPYYFFAFLAVFFFAAFLGAAFFAAAFFFLATVKSPREHLPVASSEAPGWGRHNHRQLANYGDAHQCAVTSNAYILSTCSKFASMIRALARNFFSRALIRDTRDDFERTMCDLRSQ